MEHSFETKTEVMTEWGLSLDAVYKVAITFFKGLSCSFKLCLSQFEIIFI